MEILELARGTQVMKIVIYKSIIQSFVGGPLMVQNDAGRYELVGAVSWGNGPCSSKNYPGVYARMVNKLNWIRSITENKISACA